MELVSGLIYSICIALIIYFLFYRLVSLPVSMLASRLQKIDPSAIELSSIQNISSTRKDEIGVQIQLSQMTFNVTQAGSNRRVENVTDFELALSAF